MGRSRQLKVKDIYIYIHIKYYAINIYIYIHTYIVSNIYVYIYIYTHNPTTNSGSWSSHFPERCARHVGISNLFLWLQNNRKLKSLIRMLGLNAWIKWQNLDKPWKLCVLSGKFCASILDRAQIKPRLSMVLPASIVYRFHFEVFLLTHWNRYPPLAWFIGQFFMTPSLTETQWTLGLGVVFNLEKFQDKICSGHIPRVQKWFIQITSIKRHYTSLNSVNFLALFATDWKPKICSLPKMEVQSHPSFQLTSPKWE